MTSGGRWAVAQSTIRSFGVVVFPPLFNQDLRFRLAVEDRAVAQLVPEAGVEALAIPVLPRGPGLNLGCLGTDGCTPIPESLSNELWAVVRSDVGWNAAQDEQFCQGVEDLGKVQLAFHSDRQAFPPHTVPQPAVTLYQSLPTCDVCFPCLILRFLTMEGHRCSWWT